MSTPVPISQLKINPAKFMSQAKSLIVYIENYIDRKAVRKTNFKAGKDFKEIAKELNI